MKPSIDWEAVMTAVLGLLVFGILLYGAEESVGKKVYEAQQEVVQ
jgi:hypothetical protein